MAFNRIDPILHPDTGVERKKANLQALEEVRVCMQQLSSNGARIVFNWYRLTKEQIEDGANIIPWKDLMKGLGVDSTDLKTVKVSVKDLAVYMGKIDSGEISPLPPEVAVTNTTKTAVRRVYGPK